MACQKQLANAEYFHYLDRMINDAKCAREIKSRIGIAKAAFNKKTTFFPSSSSPPTSKLDLNFRKKLLKRCVWNSILYGAETRRLRNVDWKHLESFKKRGVGEGWRRSVGPIVCKKSTAYSQEGKEYPSYKEKEGRLIGLVTSCVPTVF